MTLSQILVCQGIRETLVANDRIQFLNTIDVHKGEIIHADEEQANLCIPLNILGAIERSPVDFDGKSGRYFEEVSVSGHKYAWAFDMLWVKGMAEVPVLLIQIWDCVPDESKRLTTVFADYIA